MNVAATECAGGATPIDYVSPNSPTTSYLIDKLNGTNLTNCPTYNTLPSLQMPRNGPPYLTAAQIQTISDWISAGAPNN